ncbi:Rieske (2Fe-2S) protein [Amycolatopsis rhizosphaerae]|nr:Rieske 2Fe-2S domain-containing protein [Amycolatopsis rhizosphaerae]
MAWERTVRSEDVTGVLSRVEVRGRPVLLGRTADGRAIAVAPRCPHENRPLDGAPVTGDEISCPYHHYTYDARTGENRSPRAQLPPSLACHVRDLRVYPVQERDGWVWIRLRRLPR